jgi:gamma-glutamyl hercynylcysteine S-oxide synthase
MIDIESPTMHAAQARVAGKELLSLALIDSRNRSLRWAASCEALLARTRWGIGPMALAQSDYDPPLWVLGHLGWFQEYWVARSRNMGIAGQARLESIDPAAELYFEPNRLTREARWNSEPPELDAVRQYLAATLEATLELLSDSPEDDASLHPFRLALFHEDHVGETLAMRSQALGVAVPWLPTLRNLSHRDALLFAASPWKQGLSGPGFVFEREQPVHTHAVPEFEIDAQPVSWGQYAEFVEDGAYDDAQWWSAPGWAWVQQEGRRCPRYVEQLRHGVLVQRFGHTTRVPLEQPALHLSWYEADAWCRWAGRRLPTETEWELAAHQGAGRGFVWGQVWEWTMTGLRAYPGVAEGALSSASIGGANLSVTQPSWVAPLDGSHKVLRGGSFATHERMRHPKYRHALRPERDDAFTGFRSCAL